LAELLADVYEHTIADEDADVAAAARYRALVGALKDNHYWPALQVKRFFDRSGLSLLHNSYVREDVGAFQTLYDECRSVVLDLSAPSGEAVVVSLAAGVPRRVTDLQFEAMCAELGPEAVEESYEGTVVSVYHHAGKWRFGTSTCPSVNNSRFSHPTKTHGDMFDEALRGLLASPNNDPDQDGAELRDWFAGHLHPEHAYAFVLVHHENQRIARNTEFGDAYAKLVHISTRARGCGTALPMADQPLAPLGVLYARAFGSATDGLAWLRAHPARHGLIVKQVDGQLLRVADNGVLDAESMDMGSSNPWVNMLWVYMQSRPHYRVVDYVDRFLPGFECAMPGATPSYVLHTVMSCVRDALFEMYKRTTRFIAAHKRFKMDMQLDSALPPIIRFHLAQLRRIQVTTHSDAPVNARTVYHYLCHHQTMKNMRALLHHFAEAPESYGIIHKPAACLAFLDGALSEN
jgi:hypothetical protein